MGLTDSQTDVRLELIGINADDARARLRDRRYLDALVSLTIAETHADSARTFLVRRARAQGASWEGIATALGVSTQAAHKRYAHLTREARSADH